MRQGQPARLMRIHISEIGIALATNLSTKRLSPGAAR